jgi:hypothetical protein
VSEQDRLEWWIRLPLRIGDAHPAAFVFFLGACWIAGAVVCNALNGTGFIASLIFGVGYAIVVGFAAAFAWILLVGVAQLVCAVPAAVRDGFRRSSWRLRRRDDEGDE